MHVKHDTFATLRNCENAVHDAFKTHSKDPLALSNQIGALYSDFGQEAVHAAMINCMRIAYLKDQFRS